MPHYQHKSQNLHSAGPIIEVTIVPPQLIIEDFKTKGQNIPVHSAVALIDTGASSTCIAKDIAESLGLVSHDIKRVHTAGGEDMQCLYEVGIILPLAQKHIFFVQALEAKLDKQPYKVLIGRDVLKKCTLVYNGWDNSYTLHL